ncbi:MAG: sulfatase [Rikenellaceae bacterium]
MEDINNRLFKVVAMSVGFCGVTYGAFAKPKHAAATKHPNVIVILMDDMGNGDIQRNGAIGFNTPNINKMAAEGMMFTHFYSPQAVSGASRAGIMTGCYPNRLGMVGAPGPGAKTGINDAELTIAEMLREQGYATAAYGKWHLGDQKQFLPTHHGFDEYYGIPYSNDMWPNHPTMKFPDLPLIEGDNIIEYNPDQTRFTTDFTHRAVEFIEKNKKKPFFVYLAHPMPHVPLFVSDKFKGKSEQGLYGDVMMELDWSIGTILNKLKEENIDDNTLVIVTSDNGPWLNYGNHAGTTGGLREGKGTSFEGGQRVPCLMQWRGVIESGAICNKLSSSIDILPTLASICSARLPAHKIDGVNIMPLLKQEKDANPRKSFYYYYRANDLEAVTDGSYKLIFPHTYRTYERHLPANDGKPGVVDEYYKLEEKLLIDLRRDPGERWNVISQYPEIAERLETMAREAREDLGDNLTKTQGANRRAIGRVHDGSDKKF